MEETSGKVAIPSVILTDSGEVLSFGPHQNLKGQLGRGEAAEHKGEEETPVDKAAGTNPEHWVRTFLSIKISR